MHRFSLWLILTVVLAASACASDDDPEPRHISGADLAAAEAEMATEGGVAISGRWSGTLRTNNETTGKTSMRNVSYQISPDGFWILAPGKELTMIGQVILTGGSGSGVRSHELLEIESSEDKLRMHLKQRFESASGGSLSQDDTHAYYFFTLLAEGEAYEDAFKRTRVIPSGSRLALALIEESSFTLSGSGIVSTQNEREVSFGILQEN